MKYNILLALFLSAFISATSQIDSTTRAKSSTPRLATIYKMDGKVINGWLYKMDSNSIYLLHPNKKPKLAAVDSTVFMSNGNYSVDAVNINTIKLRKKNAVLKGALIGLGIGAAIGAIGGLASGDDKLTPLTGNPITDFFIELENLSKWKAGKKAAGLGFAGGLTGAIIGGVTGALMKKKFTIGGNRDAYHNAQVELNRLVMVKF